MINLQAALISLNVLAFVANIFPGLWHIKSRNLPAISLVVFLQLMLINGLVSAIVWGGENYVNVWKGYGWCDIMVRIQYATSVGIPSTATCILLNLYFIFLANKVTIYWFNSKWIKLTTEITISIVWPVLVGIFSYFAQPSRYKLFQYSGCAASLTGYSISILVFYFWTFFWSFATIVLSIATVVIFFHKRKEAKDILLCTNSGLSVRKFARLLTFCLIVTVLSTTLSILLGLQIKYSRNTFYNKSVHGELWGIIFTFFHDKYQLYPRWIVISISFCNFFIFGIGSDANEMFLDIVRFFGGTNLIQWCRARSFGGDKKEAYLRKFKIGNNSKENSSDDSETDLGESFREMMFVNNQNHSPTSSSKTETHTYYDPYSIAPTSATKSEKTDSLQGLYNDPVVRNQLLSAELELGKDDNLREFEYLYFG